ncbi:MAG: hypothetical protein KIT87_04725 [Anaerolineae bacterium]|nr:hypothetical protein [Anaerolineae bacterium]
MKVQTGVKAGATESTVMLCLPATVQQSAAPSAATTTPGATTPGGTV